MNMIKTIKVKKQMRLDELIKYAIETGLSNYQFTSNNNVDVYFSSSGYFLISGGKTGDGASRSIQLVDTFTVEVEKDITDDTVFEDITVVLKINSRDETGHFYNSTLKDIKKAKNLLSAYIPIGGKLQLIWERE